MSTERDAGISTQQESMASSVPPPEAAPVEASAIPVQVPPVEDAEVDIGGTLALETEGTDPSAIGAGHPATESPASKTDAVERTVRHNPQSADAARHSTARLTPGETYGFRNPQDDIKLVLAQIKEAERSTKHFRDILRQMDSPYLGTVFDEIKKSRQQLDETLRSLGMRLDSPYLGTAFDEVKMSQRQLDDTLRSLGIGSLPHFRAPPITFAESIRIAAPQNQPARSESPLTDPAASEDVPMQVLDDDGNLKMEGNSLRNGEASVEAAKAAQVRLSLYDQLGPHTSPYLNHAGKNEITGNQKTFVVSIDIRRSTELMLRATSPKDFANFMSDFCEAIKTIVWKHFGIFDKFTGDGALAFFPEGFTGRHAGVRALICAEECHELFRSHYRKYRSTFTSILSDACLGIGIDFGPVEIIRIGQSLTVVGPPAVFACRMSSVKLGRTLLNVPAHSELLQSEHAPSFRFKETKHTTKEGDLIAYVAKVVDRPASVEKPGWHIE